jgi:glycosyltransferase involved in cell wall biosynthesis
MRCFFSLSQVGDTNTPFDQHKIVMRDHSSMEVQYKLAWVYPDDLSKILDSSTHIEMTRALRKLGWNLDLLMASDEEGIMSIYGVDVICIRRPNRYILRQVVFHIKILSYLIRNWKVIHIILFNPMSAPWILSLRLLRFLNHGQGPLFVMDTRTVRMESETSIKIKIRYLFLGLMKHFSNRFVDGQTTITLRMADVLKIPSQKLWGTWPSGVVLEDFLPALSNRAWPRGDEPVKIVYIGVLSPERKLMNLCYAIEKVNREGMFFEFYLVGEGREREDLEIFARRTEGKIRVISSVPHDQIPAILSTMHVGALPFPDEQKFHVSSPIKLFEYLGAGLPILATRIPCHTEIIGDQPCAFWAEDSTMEGLTAALEDIWELRGSLSGMGYLATEIAKSYTWTASAQKLTSALKNGLEGKLKKSP